MHYVLQVETKGVDIVRSSTHVVDSAITLEDAMIKADDHARSNPSFSYQVVTIKYSVQAEVTLSTQKF